MKSTYKHWIGLIQHKSISIGYWILTQFKKLLWIVYDQLRDLVMELIERFTNSDYGNAKLGDPSSISSKRHGGFLIAKNRRLSLNKSYQNVCLYGQIGSGKTARYIIPNVLEQADQPCLTILNDPSKQGGQLTSGYCDKAGKDVSYLNWLDSSISIGFNFLILQRTYSDVKRLAELLTRASFKGSTGDVFWQSQSKMVIAVFCWIVLKAMKEQDQNMVSVSRLVGLFTTGQTDTIDAMVQEIADEKLELDYLSLVSMPEKTRQNVMASVQTVLEVFDDPEIAKVVSVGHDKNLDLSAMRKKNQILYIQNSIGSNQGYLNVLNSVFYELLFSSLLKEMPGKEDLDVFIIFEELSSLYIPLLPAFLANNRKYRIANLLCLQSNSQLDHYGKDKLNITSNCVTTIVLPGDHPVNFLREIEQRSGLTEYEHHDGSIRKKQLITMEEFRLWPENSALVIQAGKRMVKVRTELFFKSIRYKAKVQLPPFEPTQEKRSINTEDEIEKEVSNED